jgi:hypothetical protein
MKWTGCRTKWSWPNLKCCFGICLEGTHETLQIWEQVLCAGVTNPVPLKHRPGVVPPRHTCVGEGEGECRAELRAHKARSIQGREHNIRFTGIPGLKDVTSGFTREKVFNACHREYLRASNSLHDASRRFCCTRCLRGVISKDVSPKLLPFILHNYNTEWCMLGVLTSVMIGSCTALCSQ